MAVARVTVQELVRRKTSSREGAASPVLLLAAEYGPLLCHLASGLSKATFPSAADGNVETATAKSSAGWLGVRRTSWVMSLRARARRIFLCTSSPGDGIRAVTTPAP